MWPGVLPKSPNVGITYACCSVCSFCCFPGPRGSLKGLGHLLEHAIKVILERGMFGETLMGRVEPGLWNQMNLGFEHCSILCLLCNLEQVFSEL